MEVQIRPDRAPLILPWDAVDSPVTKAEYFRKSRFFLEASGYVDPKKMHHARGPNPLKVAVERKEIERGMVGLIRKAQADPSAVKAEVLRFVVAQRARSDAKEIGGWHIKNTLKPVRLALEVNDVAISWKNIMRTVPKARKRGEDREYTLDEVRRICAVVGLHIRVAVLFMASCGLRVGAFEYLKVGDVKPLEREGKAACGELTAYSGEGDDQYTTLISLEAYLAFKEYLGVRAKAGEAVSPSSPAIATRSGSRACSPGTIRNSVSDALWKAGIRTERRKRYETQADHGLRKFFDNVAKDHIPEDYVEKLIGHDTGTKEHYDRHLPKPLIEAYLRAMPYLSVDQKYRVESELSAKLKLSEEEKDVKIRDLKSAVDHEKVERHDLESLVREQDERMKRMEAWVKLWMENPDAARKALTHAKPPPPPE